VWYVYCDFWTIKYIKIITMIIILMSYMDVKIPRAKTEENKNK